DPARGLPEPPTDRGGLALDEVDLTRCRLRLRVVEPAPCLGWVTDAPLLLPRLQVEGRAVEVGEELADVDTDAPGPHDGHPVACPSPAEDEVGVGDHAGVVDALDL